MPGSRHKIADFTHYSGPGLKGLVHASLTQTSITTSAAGYQTTFPQRQPVGYNMGYRWADMQLTDGGALDSTILTNINTQIGNAHNFGVGLLIRVRCGVDTPDWVFTAGAYKMTIYDPSTDAQGRFPYWGDATYRAKYLAFHTLLSLWLEGDCPNTSAAWPCKRKNHVLNVVADRPTADFAEMSYNFGPGGDQLTYNSVGTLIGSLAAATLTGTFTTTKATTPGSVGETWLLKLGTPWDGPASGEWIQAVLTSYVGTTCTWTLATNGRGWNDDILSSIQTWNAGTAVTGSVCTGASADTAVSESCTWATNEAVSRNQTGYVDIYNTTRRTWKKSPAGTYDTTTLRDLIEDWWVEDAQDLSGVYASDVTINVAWGGVFSDSNGVGNNVIDRCTELLGSRFVTQTTSYRASVADSYASLSAANNSTIVNHCRGKCKWGLQSASWGTGNNSWLASDMIAGLLRFMAEYPDAAFLEIAPTRIQSMTADLTALGTGTGTVTVASTPTSNTVWDAETIDYIRFGDPSGAYEVVHVSAHSGSAKTFTVDARNVKSSTGAAQAFGASTVVEVVYNVDAISGVTFWPNNNDYISNREFCYTFPLGFRARY